MQQTKARRYCIQQDDAHDKHIQIRNMDIIYANAFLTIVAATGDSSDYGLPGVGSNIRHPEQLAKVQDKYLTIVRPDPRAAVERSTWMTRGWTYQEVVLSTRRLVFTDEQVSFECDSMRCCESVDNCPEKFQSKIKAGTYTNNSTFKGIGQENDDICKHIEEYTKRSLTYDSDIVNGILGIFSAYEQLEKPMHHLWGVPLFSWPNLFRATLKATSNIHHSRTQKLVQGLWWQSSGETQRRYGFPSWSWTGWTGAVVFTRWGEFLKEIHVLVEMKNGDLVDVEQFEGLAKGFTQYQTILQPNLHIETTTWKVRFQYAGDHTLKQIPKHIWYCCWKRDYLHSYYSVVYIPNPPSGSSLENFLKNGIEITCLLFRDGRLRSSGHVLLVDEKAGNAERVGIAEMRPVLESGIFELKGTKDIEIVTPEMITRRRIRLS
jgi:hypothetical protein